MRNPKAMTKYVFMQLMFQRFIFINKTGPSEFSSNLFYVL
jgi:hypothetical protein